MELSSAVALEDVKAVVVETLGVEDRADTLDADTPLSTLPELDSMGITAPAGSTVLVNVDGEWRIDAIGQLGGSDLLTGLGGGNSTGTSVPTVEPRVTTTTRAD